VSGERGHPPSAGIADTYCRWVTGAHLIILLKTNTHVIKTYSTLPHSSTGY